MGQGLESAGFSCKGRGLRQQGLAAKDSAMQLAPDWAIHMGTQVGAFRGRVESAGVLLKSVGFTC